jgi:hypothetical protein
LPLLKLTFMLNTYIQMKVVLEIVVIVVYHTLIAEVRINAKWNPEAIGIIDSHHDWKNQVVYKPAPLSPFHRPLQACKSVYLTQQGDERVVDVFIGSVMGFDGIIEANTSSTVAVNSGVVLCDSIFFRCKNCRWDTEVKTDWWKWWVKRSFSLKSTRIEYNLPNKSSLFKVFWTFTLSRKCFCQSVSLSNFTARFG